MLQVIKDFVVIFGIFIILGLLLFVGQVLEYDVIVVEWVKSSGVIVIGKINVLEFGFGLQIYNLLFGIICNVYDLVWIVGGSSGGVVVVLVLCMLLVVDGSDMMGLLCNFVVYNNVYGFCLFQGWVLYGL